MRQEVLDAQRLGMLRALAGSTGGAFFVVGADLSVIHWDESAEAELGWSRDRALGRHCLRSVHCDDCLAGCAMAARNRDHVVPIRRADGSTGWYERSLFPLLDDEKRFLGGAELLVPVAAPLDEGETTELDDLVTSDPRLGRAFVTVARLAHSRLPLHLEGADADLVLSTARRIHERSPVTRPFRVVDASLLDRVDLRGGDPCEGCGLLHRPAFAQGQGTILLAEIPRAPRAIQAALQRWIVHEWSCRHGNVVRVVTSSQRPLPDELRAGRIDPVLHDTLSPIRLHLPSLASRRGDVQRLVLGALAELEDEDEDAGVAHRFSRDAMHLLVTHPWPGGAAALRLAVSWAYRHARGDVIQVVDLPSAVREGVDPKRSRSDLGEEAEALKLQHAIRHAEGNLTRAAEILGISRATLWRRRKKYGV